MVRMDLIREILKIIKKNPPKNKNNMNHLRTFENYGTPQKFNINGIEASFLAGPPSEIYFPKIDQVINLGHDTKFAESVFFYARLMAEDGKREKEIYDSILDKLRKLQEM